MVFSCFSHILCIPFFFIRTSNFGAEAERSYIFLRFEAENVFKMFLNYMVYTTCISVNQSDATLVCHGGDQLSPHLKRRDVTRKPVKVH